MITINISIEDNGKTTMISIENDKKGEEMPTTMEILFSTVLIAKINEGTKLLDEVQKDPTSSDLWDYLIDLKGKEDE